MSNENDKEKKDIKINFSFIGKKNKSSNSFNTSLDVLKSKNDSHICKNCQNQDYMRKCQKCSNYYCNKCNEQIFYFPKNKKKENEYICHNCCNNEIIKKKSENLKKSCFICDEYINEKNNYKYLVNQTQKINFKNELNNKGINIEEKEDDLINNNIFSIISICNKCHSTYSELIEEILSQNYEDKIKNEQLENNNIIDEITNIISHKKKNNLNLNNLNKEKYYNPNKNAIQQKINLIQKNEEIKSKLNNSNVNKNFIQNTNDNKLFLNAINNYNNENIENIIQNYDIIKNDMKEKKNKESLNDFNNQNNKNNIQNINNCINSIKNIENNFNLKLIDNNDLIIPNFNCDSNSNSNDKFNFNLNKNQNIFNNIDFLNYINNLNSLKLPLNQNLNENNINNINNINQIDNKNIINNLNQIPDNKNGNFEYDISQINKNINTNNYLNELNNLHKNINKFIELNEIGNLQSNLNNQNINQNNFLFYITNNYKNLKIMLEQISNHLILNDNYNFENSLSILNNIEILINIFSRVSSLRKNERNKNNEIQNEKLNEIKENKTIKKEEIINENNDESKKFENYINSMLKINKNIKNKLLLIKTYNEIKNLYVLTLFKNIEILISKLFSNQPQNDIQGQIPYINKSPQEINQSNISNNNLFNFNIPTKLFNYNIKNENNIINQQNIPHLEYSDYSNPSYISLMNRILSNNLDMNINNINIPDLQFNQEYNVNDPNVSNRESKYTLDQHFPYVGDNQITRENMNNQIYLDKNNPFVK